MAPVAFGTFPRSLGSPRSKGTSVRLPLSAKPSSFLHTYRRVGVHSAPDFDSGFTPQALGILVMGMNKLTVDSRTPAVTMRLLTFAHEMEELDRVGYYWPERYAPRAELVAVLHDAVERLGEDLTKIMG